MRSLWMLVAGFMFACMGMLVKFSADYFSSIEMVFYRSFFGVLVAYMVIRHYALSFATPYWKIHCWRGAYGLCGMLLFFYCLTHLPLATAVSLNYTWPLFLALFSILILKERLNWPLIIAIIIGFAGIILLLQPTLPENHGATGLAGLASGFFAAIAYLKVKQLSNLGEPEWRIVFYFTLTCTLITGIWLVMFSPFNPITPNNMYLLLGTGITATLGQLALTRAYHTGKTLIVGSLGYSTVLFAGLFGIFFWNELLSPLAWLGMGLIILAGFLSSLSKAMYTLIVENIKCLRKDLKL